ncbi:MAG: phosphoribosyl-AMP cyclohydrolase [SAR324 cluster bacterium]|nr:phosphoribosyl-AMP cyclohydrolase [SAR324 cluster bacterium]
MNLELDFDKSGGLIPAIIQDWETGEVLMLGYMNAEAFDKTQASGIMHYHSRSRNGPWMKGETSGHFQEVKEILIDCDQDAVLVKVHQVGGAACHTGYNSCFFRRLGENGVVEMTKDSKVFDPEKVYGK